MDGTGAGRYMVHWLLITLARTLIIGARTLSDSPSSRHKQSIGEAAQLYLENHHHTTESYQGVLTRSLCFHNNISPRAPPHPSIIWTGVTVTSQLCRLMRSATNTKSPFFEQINIFLSIFRRELILLNFCKIRRIVREWYLFLCDSYHLFLISTWLSAGNNLYAVFQKNKSNGLCRNAHLHISMWSGYIIYHILMSVFNIQIMGKPLALTIKYVYKD